MFLLKNMPMLVSSFYNIFDLDYLVLQMQKLSMQHQNINNQ